MEHADRAVALRHRVDEDAEAEDVRHLLECDLLALHLAPHRIRRLLAALDIAFDPVGGERGGDLVLDRLDAQVVASADVVEPRLDRRVGVGLEVAEGQVLELVAQALHAHAPGERGVDVQRLLGDARALVGRHELQGAHIVQAIGELDEQHAHVGGDRQQELAEVLGLDGALGDEVEPLQLGQPLDERADLVAEQPVDLLARRFGVLDDVVQHRGDDRRVVEIEVGEDRRDLERMREIRVARGAHLRAVRLHRVDVGAVEQNLVGLRVVASHPLDQLVLAHHGGGLFRPEE